MQLIAQPVARAIASVFGYLMVALVAVDGHGPDIAAGIAGLIGVGVGTILRRAATIAVLMSVFVIVVADPPHLLVALSGLFAAAYLVCTYHCGAPVGGVVGSWPTIVAAVGFSFAGVVATSFPLQVPWLPLVAPLAVLAIYVLATRPFLG
ncbi:hypothetical protein MB901379_01298 [Mycobacterium basiliense]|uniref:Integral membrane protein n=1 Tax=Mycobacterium basiliense TaxID=2094119 RepID=A0A447GBA0_9MYCO|nr:hypothetical protein [Mycobacterium basiliense]VDM87751.1 hypothetical protein MB901379_01298 [Mycobacterium basiliense]